MLNTPLTVRNTSYHNRPMTQQEREIRDQIVELMKVRAGLTAKSKAKEWRRVDRQIIALQRKRDRIRATCN